MVVAILMVSLITIALLGIYVYDKIQATRYNCPACKDTQRITTMYGTMNCICKYEQREEEMTCNEEVYIEEEMTYSEEVYIDEDNINNCICCGQKPRTFVTHTEDNDRGDYYDGRIQCLNCENHNGVSLNHYNSYEIGFEKFCEQLINGWNNNNPIHTKTFNDVAKIFDKEPLPSDINKTKHFISFNANGIEIVYFDNNQLQLSNGISSMGIININPPEAYNIIKALIDNLKAPNNRNSFKPCPFCGEEPKIKKNKTYRDTDYPTVSISCINKHCPVQPSCFETSDKTYKGDYTNLIDRWNKRKSLGEK